MLSKQRTFLWFYRVLQSKFGANRSRGLCVMIGLDLQTNFLCIDKGIWFLRIDPLPLQKKLFLILWGQTMKNWISDRLHSFWNFSSKDSINLIHQISNSTHAKTYLTSGRKEFARKLTILKFWFLLKSRKDLFLNLSSILEKDGDLAVTIVAELGDEQYQVLYCTVL